MNEDPDTTVDDLSLRVIQGIADEADRAELLRLMTASADCRRRFADSAMLHGMLVSEGRSGSFAKDANTYFQRLEHPSAGLSQQLRRYLLPIAALLLISLFVVSVLPTRAGAALDQLIGQMDESHDRAYRIQVIEAPQDASASHADRGRFPVANYLDGATLWIRGEKEFLLRQSLPNGQVRMIGADGKQSWSIRGDEPLHLSKDPDRFSRAIFTKNGDIAFLDLRNQLHELKQRYQLSWTDRTSSELWKLSGTRNTIDQGGPREIEVWFDPRTQILHRMILRQLPRAHGGPRSIAIILQSSDPLPADWFQHLHHHEPERTIIEEP